MLRLPKLSVVEPCTVEEALSLLATHGKAARPIAGGTDLLPNLKHRIVDADLLVSLGRVDGLRGIALTDDGGLEIGAMTTLDEIAAHALVAQRAPALAQAARLVASPQIRRMGTLGGNLLLDTRCRYVNQTHFWRQALGFCLKKDGTVCHVVAGGKKCVAAASNDTAPALMTLGATLELQRTDGRRTIAIDDLWRSDGVMNKKLEPSELLVRVRVPPQRGEHRGAYGKLRQRGSFDFPEFGVAVRLELESGVVVDADVVVVALQARPLRIKGASEALRGQAVGSPAFDDATRAVADRAHQQCHPMPNIPGDPEYRREMVPVYVRRTLRAAAGLP